MFGALLSVKGQQEGPAKFQREVQNPLNCSSNYRARYREVKTPFNSSPVTTGTGRYRTPLFKPVTTGTGSYRTSLIAPVTKGIGR